MNTISREELKMYLDGQEPVQVMMTLSSWAYDRLHIAGSVGIDALPDLVRRPNRDQAIIVYDTNPACPASYRVYYLLKSLGFTNLRYFVGGIEEWLDAGYPVDGSMAGEQVHAAA